MEQLIKEVRKHPCLYDVTSDNYRDVLRKDNSWEEIAKTLDCDSKGIRHDWKKLRDCFRQALARKKTTSGQAARNRKPWRYEKQMEFLIPFMSARETTTNIEDINEEDDGDEDILAIGESDMQVEMPASVSTSKEPDTCRPNKKKRKSTTTSDVDKVITYLHEKRENTTKQDDLDHFFISACQSTRKLSRRLQNRVKREVLDSIARAEDQQEYEMPAHTYTPSPVPYTSSPVPSPYGGTHASNESNSSIDNGQGSGFPQTYQNLM